MSAVRRWRCSVKDDGSLWFMSDAALVSGSDIRSPWCRAALWRDWTLSCAAGELIGIGVAAGVATLLLLTIGEPETGAERWGVLVAMVGAGAIEGTAIGFFQWRVLRRPFPGISARAWVGTTVAVAVIGWFLGMLPSTLAAPNVAAQDPFDPPLWMTALLATFTGLGAGLVFGLAQWGVLRRHARNASSWIVANALGWGLALAWIYAAAALPAEGASLGTVIAIGSAGGILAGLSVGAVTGGFLLQIVRGETGRPP